MGSVRATSRWKMGAVLAVTLATVTVACTTASGGGGGGGFGPPEGHPTTSTILKPVPPTGLWTFMNTTCYANILGNFIDFPQPAQVVVDAPITVQQGDQFDIWLAPGDFAAPTVVQGYVVNAVSTMVIRFPVPDNAVFVDAVMTSSVNTGPGYPAIWEDGGQIIAFTPGPFVPGDVVELPAVKLTLEATGPIGSTIQTSMAQLSTLAYFDLGVVGNTCLPDYNYIFSNTTIT